MDENDLKIWAMFYCAVHSMQLHPGHKHPWAPLASASEADEMLEHYFRRKSICHGSKQEPQSLETYSDYLASRLRTPPTDN